MKTIHVTGVELAQNGQILIRTVTVTKRWWHRRQRYVARLFLGDYGNWRDSRGRRVSKSVWKFLDEAYLRAVEAAGGEPVDRHTGYDPAAFTNGPVREVSRPSARS